MRKCTICDRKLTSFILKILINEELVCLDCARWAAKYTQELVLYLLG